MTAADLKCRACGVRLQPGETLRVTPTDGSESFVIHRCAAPWTACLRAAGTADQTRIAPYDAAEADRWDRAQGGATTYAADAASARRAHDNARQVGGYLEAAHGK